MHCWYFVNDQHQWTIAIGSRNLTQHQIQSMKMINCLIWPSLLSTMICDKVPIPTIVIRWYIFLLTDLIGLNWYIAGTDGYAIEKQRIDGGGVVDNCHLLIQNSLDHYRISNRAIYCFQKFSPIEPQSNNYCQQWHYIISMQCYQLSIHIHRFLLHYANVDIELQREYCCV
jgi:hypothetical protein